MRSQLRSLRSTIPKINGNNYSSEIEEFQNNTIRPILKFQNSLILSIFQDYLDKHKRALNELSADERDGYIEQLIRKDRKLYYLLQGVVIGHFTDSEWQCYISYKKELNKRISDLVIQRIQSQN